MEMPQCYMGDALHGGTKVDGINRIIGDLLEQGAQMKVLQKALTDLGRRENAARQHLAFLHKNEVCLFVNGVPYQKGMPISLNDWVTLR